MDLLEIVKEKAKRFKKTVSEEGINAVIHHIDIAENHYRQGNENDEYFFTDVIYRANHAFEGALKEGYRVLAGGDPRKKKPYQIERYFEEADILKSRVLSQFTTYRQEWRNESTHDYQLFFSSQEALLAVVSVTAFFNILLDQMHEKISYETEKEKLNTSALKPHLVLENYSGLNFMDQCIKLFKLFSNELKNETDEQVVFNEIELHGRVTAFISELDPAIEIYSEREIDHASGKLHLDLLLKKGEDEVIVEIKGPTQQYDRKVVRAIDQVRHYLIACRLDTGIVYAPVLRSSTKTEFEEHEVETKNGNVRIVAITPAIGNA